MVEGQSLRRWTEVNARDVILNRIRTAIGPSPSIPSVPRGYRISGQHGPGTPELLEQLTERLIDYKATVHTCTPDGLAATLLDLTRNWRVVIPAGSGISIPGAIHDEPHLTHAELNDIDAAVTSCAAACADTGTIVLDATAGQGRRALTLIPDRHVCVVYSHQVVHTIPELVRRLGPLRPLTFISGPSATSDIELDRVEGVHGPRNLIVVLVSDTDTGR